MLDSVPAEPDYESQALTEVRSLREEIMRLQKLLAEQHEVHRSFVQKVLSDARGDTEMTKAAY